MIHRVMLHAPFLLARALLPGMYAAGWGRIVHVSSVHGHRASPYKSAYVSAKHGLEGLSKVIALEAADKGVTSNTVCPGYVRTPLVEGQIADQATSHGIAEDEVLDEVLLARTPVKRLVEPDEVAALVAFLCGPGTDSINGSSYLMDGGWTAALTTDSTSQIGSNHMSTTIAHAGPRRDPSAQREWQQHRQGRLRQPRRHRGGVVRLLPLRLGRGPRLRHAVLPGRRPRQRDPAGVRHLRRRLRRPAARRRGLRPLR